MSARAIEQRAEFLRAVRFSFEQRDEIERVMDWLTDNPDDAAAYIVWLEAQIQ